MSFDNATHVDVGNFIKELRLFHGKEFPRVIKTGLILTTRTAAKFARENVAKEFVNRNKFTLRSVRYNQVHGTRPSNMFSEMGSVQEYMALQEHGGTKRNENGGNAPLATRSARVGRSRKKQTKKRMRLSQVGTLPEFRGNDVIEKLALFAKTGKKRKLAVVQGNKIKRGVYSIVRSPKKKIGAPFNMTMLHSLDKKSYQIDATKWMEPAVIGATKPKRLMWAYSTGMKQYVKNYKNGKIT
jgi:hypothetical protein